MAITSLLAGPVDDEPAPPTPGPAGSSGRATSRGVKAAARAMTHKTLGKTSARGLRTASSARVTCTCRSGRGSTASRTPFDRTMRP
eukprot:2663043-Alexandrium_andersonii.AAC.1